MLVAIAVPAASAALPEVGRCVAVVKGAGKYKGGACITNAPSGGSFEWMPATATEKQTFKGSGSSVVIATAGHPTLTCVTANISGEYTGPKTATVELELQACTEPSGKQCQTTPAQPSEIKSVPLEAELGFIKREAPGMQVGLDLKPKSPLTTIATYECGTPTESARIEGSVIAAIKPLDKMTTVSDLLFRVSKKTGAQVPENLEGAPKDTLSTTFMSGIESSSGASTLSMLEEVGANTNPLEIKAKEL
ncbi:MAG TPA: hypothetical protein VGN13_02085 [Solirubrobacteraceae bacterium]